MILGDDPGRRRSGKLFAFYSPDDDLMQHPGSIQVEDAEVLARYTDDILRVEPFFPG
jgi:hypothetical protein